MMDEIWADISGFNGMYQVSTHGRVKSLSRILRKQGREYLLKERILKPGNRNGYLYVGLHENKRTKWAFIHRLVATMFVPNPRGVDCINHMDCNPLNNSVENIEWCTRAENNQHAWDNGCQEKLREIMKRGLRNKAVLQLDLDGNVIGSFSTIKEASAETGANHAHISSCCQNQYGRKTCGGFKWKYSN